MIYTILANIVGWTVVAYILFLIVVGVCHMAKLFTVDFYRHWKYTTRGLCPGCHQPASLLVLKAGQMYGSSDFHRANPVTPDDPIFVSIPADQMYGPAWIEHLVCVCGAKSIPTGNRHAAEW